jgi:hypothetical protein
MMGKIMKRNDFGKIVNYTMKGNNKSKLLATDSFIFVVAFLFHSVDYFFRFIIDFCWVLPGWIQRFWYYQNINLPTEKTTFLLSFRFFQNIVGYEQRSFIEYRNLTVPGRKSRSKVLEQDSFLSWIGEQLHLILPL